VKVNNILLFFLLSGFVLATERAAPFYRGYLRNERNVNNLYLVKEINPYPFLWQSCQCPAYVNNLYSSDLHPSDANEFIELARASFYRGDYTSTIEILNNSSTSNKRKDLQDYFMGAAYVCVNDIQSASRYWREAEMGARSFRQIRQCRQIGEMSRADLLYDLALEIDPRIWDGKQTSSPIGAWFYQPAADVARDRGDAIARLHWLQLSWDEDPNASYNNYRLGEYFEQSGDLRDAQAYFSRIKVLFPTDPNGYLSYSRVSFGLGEWENGIAAIRVLLSDISPDSEQQWRNVSALIRQNANPTLCESIKAMLNEFSPAKSADIMASIENIRIWCS